MDYTITWGGDPEDLWLKTRGVASVDDLDVMMREAVADRRWRSGMNILLDHTDCDWSPMSLGEIEERAMLLVRMSAEIGSQRCAFVVGDASSYGVGRLLGLLLDAQVGFRAHAFMSVPEARTWLAQSGDDQSAHVLPDGA